MRERPILFSAPMVRAILDGRKTQTRRIVKPVGRDADFVMVKHGHVWWPYRSDDGESMFHTVRVGTKLYQHETPFSCPFGAVGDRLWVREAWARDDEDGLIFYRADVGQGGDADDWQRQISDGATGYRWRPSIHMPRWASRITLEVTGVRVERLRDISNEDARAEGVLAQYAEECVRLGHPYNATDLFRQLWASINGLGSWNENPFVWVVEFRRISDA